MFKKGEKKLLNQPNKYIWKAISYVFIAILIGLNIWLIVMLNSNPGVQGNDLVMNFNVYKNAFDVQGITKITVSNQGIAFYVVSSAMLLLAMLYGIGLYRLHQIKAMWSYFLLVTLFAISFTLTFVLVNGDGPNNLELYKLVSEKDKVSFARLNLFFEVTKNATGYQFSKLQSSWIYNAVEIVLFVIVLPLCLVFTMSRKVQPIQQYV